MVSVNVGYIILLVNMHALFISLDFFYQFQNVLIISMKLKLCNRVKEIFIFLTLSAPV
jgi:hypothetical protein